MVLRGFAWVFLLDVVWHILLSDLVSFFGYDFWHVLLNVCAMRPIIGNTIHLWKGDNRYTWCYIRKIWINMNNCQNKQQTRSPLSAVEVQHRLLDAPEPIRLKPRWLRVAGILLRQWKHVFKMRRRKLLWHFARWRDVKFYSVSLRQSSHSVCKWSNYRFCNDDFVYS